MNDNNNLRHILPTPTTGEEQPAGYNIPDHTFNSMLCYVEDRRPMSHFLTAVISNDLNESFARADGVNRAALRDIVRWFYNHAPGACWGSPERYEAWLERKENE